MHASLILTRRVGIELSQRTFRNNVEKINIFMIFFETKL